MTKSQISPTSIAIADQLLDTFLSEGISLVVFDFDLTILRIHSFHEDIVGSEIAARDWQNDFADLSTFRALILALDRHNKAASTRSSKVHFAIASFGHLDVIMAYIRLAFGPDQRLFTPANILSRDFSQRRGGPPGLGYRTLSKTRMIRDLQIRFKVAEPAKVIFFDDDVDNISEVGKHGVRAILVPSTHGLSLPFWIQVLNILKTHPSSTFAFGPPPLPPSHAPPPRSTPAPSPTSPALSHPPTSGKVMHGGASPSLGPRSLTLSSTTAQAAASTTGTPLATPGSHTLASASASANAATASSPLSPSSSSVFDGVTVYDCVKPYSTSTYDPGYNHKAYHNHHQPYRDVPYREATLHPLHHPHLHYSWAPASQFRSQVVLQQVAMHMNTNGSMEHAHAHHTSMHAQRPNPHAQFAQQLPRNQLLSSQALSNTSNNNQHISIPQHSISRGTSEDRSGDQRSPTASGPAGLPRAHRFPWASPPPLAPLSLSRSFSSTSSRPALLSSL